MEELQGNILPFKKKKEKRKKKEKYFEILYLPQHTYQTRRKLHPPQSTVTSVQFVQSCLNVPAGFALAGLELDEPLVHRLQDGRVHLLHDVLQLVGVCLQVVDLHKRLCVGGVRKTQESLGFVALVRRRQSAFAGRATHLAVRELAVLHVQLAVEGPDAGVSVVVGVLAHAVWETLLGEARVGTSAAEIVTSA